MFARKALQSFAKNWKNCASSVKAVPISKTLTEYTMRNSIAIASNNCLLYDLRLTNFRIKGIRMKKKKNLKELEPSPLAKN